MAIALGITQIFWRGKQYEVGKGSKIRLAGNKNNVVNGNFKAFRVAEYQAGEVEAVIITAQGVSPSDFAPALGEGELQIHGDTGQTWVIADAWVSETATWQDDGHANVKWNFNICQEIKS